METDGSEVKADVTLSPEQTKTPNVETYTKEQVDKLVRDARSAVLADAGRSKKAAEDALARLNQLEKERQEAELEAAKDDPPALAHIREKQAHQQTKAELETARQELNEKTERIQQWDAEQSRITKEQNAREIAMRLNVDPVKLANLAKFTDGTPESIEALAKELPKNGKKSLKPDSGSMIGGMETWEQVRVAYIKDPRNTEVKEKYLAMRRERKR